MGSVRFLFRVFCFVIVGGSGLFDRGLLNGPSLPSASLPGGARDWEASRVARDKGVRDWEVRHRVAKERIARDRVVGIAAGEVGVREFSGRNDGKVVEGYLAYVGLKRGQPYCAAWVCWVFGQAGYARPRTGWSPALFPDSRITREVLPGNVMGIWFPSLGRVGHVGIVERKWGDWCQTLEANTNLEGSREGQGVYRRLRHKRTIHCYSNWLD